MTILSRERQRTDMKYSVLISANGFEWTTYGRATSLPDATTLYESVIANYVRLTKQVRLSESVILRSKIGKLGQP